MAEAVRQTAVKVSIKNINDATYIVQTGWDPNFLTLPDGRNAYRVNVIGIVVSFQSDAENILLDDGTGQMLIRGLQDIQVKEIGLGDLVRVIGKIRVFNDQKYITPEAINKVSERLWMDVRRKELQIIKEGVREEEQKGAPKKVFEPQISQTVHPQKENEEGVTKKEERDNPVEIIFQFIKNNDEGNGVLIEKIIEKTSIPQSEQIITTLLMEGNIFEVTPGRVKVLE